MDSPSKTIDSLNRVRKVMKLLQIIEVAAVFAAILWCLPAVARTTAACLTHLCNQQAAFLFGNVIVMLLLALCRQSVGGAGDDLHDDYVRHSEIACALPPPAEIGDKQLVAADETMGNSQSQCDDVAAVIEKAARQMRKLQKNRSELAKRRKVKVRPELQRSETENRRETVKGF
ncbi:hypothetical protein SASPL_126773 [Salvia splendens]|uniref:Uncharacterized protein n=1 Tax=Salvia splendens TaxID=180675 RepID=A0A8X8ZRG7_SALSN|nr:hypothetical protein SASPL_126773 [Salvia splendens]